MSNKDDYNWLDDPFDKKKDREIEEQGMSGHAKAFVGIGCIVGIILVVAAAVLGVGLVGTLTTV